MIRDSGLCFGERRSLLARGDLVTLCTFDSYTDSGSLEMASARCQGDGKEDGLRVKIGWEVV